MCAKLTALETSPLSPARNLQKAATILLSRTLEKRDFCEPVSVCVSKSAWTHQQTPRGTDHTHGSQRYLRFLVRVGGWDPSCFVQPHVRNETTSR